MCALRYQITEELRNSSSSSTKPASAIDHLLAVDAPNELREIARFVGDCEQQLSKGQEFAPEQLRELRSYTLRLLDVVPTDEAQRLDAMISRLIDRNIRLRSVNFIHSLEDQYDALSSELRDEATTLERKTELAKAQREISETLRILRH